MTRKTRRTKLDLDNERQSERLSNTPRERRIAAEHARARAAIEDARMLLRRNGYHVINGNGVIDTGTILSILGDWYRTEIRSIADSITTDVRIERGIDPMPRWCAGRACELRGVSEDAVREWVSERVDQDTDGHEYVIYTYKAKLVLVASDNEDAADNEYGPGEYTVEQRACMAMRADVWEILNAREDAWLTVDPPDEDPDPNPSDDHDLRLCPCERCIGHRQTINGLVDRGKLSAGFRYPATGPSDNEIESHSGHGGTCGLVACTAEHERESDEAIEERERTDPGGNGTPGDAAAVRAEIAARQRGRDDTREREHAEIVRAREHAQDD